MLPTGTPAAAVQRWNRKMNLVLFNTEVKGCLRTTEVEVSSGNSTRSEAMALARETSERNAELVSRLKLSGE